MVHAQHAFHGWTQVWAKDVNEYIQNRDAYWTVLAEYLSGKVSTHVLTAWNTVMCQCACAVYEFVKGVQTATLRYCQHEIQEPLDKLQGRGHCKKLSLASIPHIERYLYGIKDDESKIRIQTSAFDDCIKEVTAQIQTYLRKREVAISKLNRFLIRFPESRDSYEVLKAFFATVEMMISLQDEDRSFAFVFTFETRDFVLPEPKEAERRWKKLCEILERRQKEGSRPA
jgi:hypothetical protein